MLFKAVRTGQVSAPSIHGVNIISDPEQDKQESSCPPLECHVYFSIRPTIDLVPVSK
ncbi:hypothetical protein KQS06HV_90652 [Klebsiella quasipneumoniae subsp. similipneumoniae]|jgi:hypothetical protein|nr:hypothetical protein KQS06HV_90652 [Klebsiella quasipneumoniae subsp. similipneumoniae]